MRKLGMTVLAVVAMVALAPTARAAEMAKGGDAKAAIETLQREFAAAWNAHDGKKLAMLWEEDGSLINPFGRVAQGRAAVEKLVTDEQTTGFKASTYTSGASTVRMLSPTVALLDWDATITGALDASGKTLPPVTPHLNAVLRETHGEWRIAAARPVIYMAPPAPAMAPAAH